MNAEESFREEVRYVLNQIKKQSLMALKGESIIYDIRGRVITPGVPSPENKRAIVSKLEEMGVIKILDEIVASMYGLESGPTAAFELKLQLNETPEEEFKIKCY